MGMDADGHDTYEIMNERSSNRLNHQGASLETPGCQERGCATSSGWMSIGMLAPCYDQGLVILKWDFLIDLDTVETGGRAWGSSWGRGWVPLH